MTDRFHTIVIGGGILGCSTAIALAKRLGTRGQVCLLDKTLVGAGLSSRHSGIVRAADGFAAGAGIAGRATEAWKNLENSWGVAIPSERTGALWIAPGSADTGAHWRKLVAQLMAAGIEIHALAPREAADLTGAAIHVDEGELCFFEPGALALDPAEVLRGARAAIGINGITLKERTETTGFETNASGRIVTVKTSRGDLPCDFVVNAAGPWSPALFAALGLTIPVALVPAYIAHWLAGPSEIADHLPIIGDYVNRTCFRRWPGSLIRMHQPRDRRSSAIARTFSQEKTSSASADIVFESSNYFSHHGLVHQYQEQLQRRFPKVSQPIFSGGFISYYDITPDLRFVLGPDPDVENLVHCLGAGTGFKFAPLFGEFIAEAILDGRVPEELAEFSIARFRGRPIEEFWDTGESPEYAGASNRRF